VHEQIIILCLDCGLCLWDVLCHIAVWKLVQCDVTCTCDNRCIIWQLKYSVILCVECDSLCTVWQFVYIGVWSCMRGHHPTSSWAETLRRRSVDWYVCTAATIADVWDSTCGNARRRWLYTYTTVVLSYSIYASFQKLIVRLSHCWCCQKLTGKGKGKRGFVWHLVVITPLRRSGMACKGSRSLPAHPCTSANGMNHTCLCHPSRSWYSFTVPVGMDDWVVIGWLVG